MIQIQGMLPEALLYITVIRRSFISEILHVEFDFFFLLRCSYLASGKGFDEIVEILLQHGAKPDIPDKSGSTPLHRCAINGHAVIAKFLIAAGANVDAQDAEGYSALHLACLERNLRVALVLIHEGKANLNCKAKNGKIPLDFVPEIHRSALLEPLQIYP